MLIDWRLSNHSTYRISAANDLPCWRHCGGELLCCRAACEAEQASDDVGVTRTGTARQQSDDCKRDSHLAYQSNSKNSLPTPSALARYRHRPTTGCQLSLSRGRRAMMKTKRGRSNRLERELWTCLCDLLHVHDTQYTIEAATELCEGRWRLTRQGWTVGNTFLKCSKSASRLILNSEVKLCFKTFIPTVTQIVAKLIINRKDDRPFFWGLQTR